jgi:predicted transcriptional regulator
MAIVWQKGSALVGEVTELVNRRRAEPLAYKTVLTICTRLSEKGLLTHRRDGRAFRYAPALSEEAFVEAQATRAAAALLDTFGPAAIAPFVDAVSADAEQLKTLRALLDQASPQA